MTRATIVVPAYNTAKTLPATMLSLLAQRFADFEVVIVDDGSHDETSQIAIDFEQDPRVRVVRQANRGLAGARNTGIAAARGEYIGFCDADDLWAPGKLAAHVRHLDSAPHVGISFSGSALIDGNGRPTGLTQRPRLTGIDPAHVFKRNPIGNGSSAVMRRAAIESISWRPWHERERDWVFDETFSQSEDIECWLRLAISTDWEIEGVPGALVQYRVNSSGLSASTTRQLAAWERMVTKLTPYDPSFFARHTPTARAYQLRYLARRAVSARDPKAAEVWLQKSWQQSARPLFEEPVKTLTTAAAVALLGLAGGAAIAKAETVIRRARRVGS